MAGVSDAVTNEDPFRSRLGRHGAELGAHLLRQLDERARGWAAVAVAVPDDGDRARRDVVELDDAHALVLLVDRRRGTTAAPRPAATMPCTVPLWSERKTKRSGSGEKVSSWFSPRQCRKPIRSSPAAAASVVVSGSFASAAGRARRDGAAPRMLERSSGSGRSANVRSSSPRSIWPSSSTSFAASSSETSTRGQPSTKRDISVGRMCCPTLW